MTDKPVNKIVLNKADNKPYMALEDVYNILDDLNNIISEVRINIKTIIQTSTKPEVKPSEQEKTPNNITK